ncbi:MAG TPA: trigger factor [Roseiarcus sp.]|nr:trigger factor [Roseiarcus sp.]
MQVTQTLSEGLKREYNIVLSASDLASRLDAQLADLKTKVKIKGFRPGKVPVAHLKRVYGRSVMSEVVQEAINSANKQIVDENGLRLAQEPKIELPTDKDAIEAALEARGDLAFKVALEVLPKFEIGDFSDLTLERPVAEVEDSEVEAALQRLAQDRRVYSDKPEGAKAENFDRVTVDFVGTIDGEAFEGGSSEGIEVVIGSNTFIPGFEEQLLGAVAGERRAVQATFPEAYAVRKLAGQKADFDVTVKAVAAPEPFALDDEFAKSLGAESLDQVKQTLRERIRADYARASREKVKRKLLDALAARYSFEVPQGLVDQEFASIWAQVEREQQASGRTFADENTTEEAARAEYRAIAERRVRLGLLLAEVGAKADVKISDEEMTQALVARARAFPGQEKQVWDFYRNNQQALAELRAPLYEEKVVDHILGLAKVEDRKVTAKELLQADEDEVSAK